MKVQTEVVFMGLLGSKALTRELESEANKISRALPHTAHLRLTIRSYRQHHGKAPVSIKALIKTQSESIEVCLHAPRRATNTQIHSASKQALQSALSRLFQLNDVTQHQSNVLEKIPSYTNTIISLSLDKNSSESFTNTPVPRLSISRATADFVKECQPRVKNPKQARSEQRANAIC